MQEQQDNKSKEDKQEQRETRTAGAHKTGIAMRAGYRDREGAATNVYALRCNFQAVEA